MVRGAVMRLRNAEHMPARRRGNVPPGRGAEWAPRAYWRAPGALARAMSAAVGPPGTEVAVYVNEARWVVDCPDCGGAQLACHTDRRFMCNECANVVVGGRWRRVVWPANPEAIEAALAGRPPRNQNWQPGETEADLRAENLLHGLVEGVV